MAYPRFQRARQHKFVTGTAGNITANTPATTWQELAAEAGGPGTGAFDIDLAEVQVGDVLEACLSVSVGNESVAISLDVATVVSSTVTNWFASAGSGTGYGFVFTNVAQYDRKSGVFWYTVVPADLTAGAVKLRPMVRTDSATNRTVRAISDNPFQFAVRNIGPAQT